MRCVKYPLIERFGGSMRFASLLNHSAFLTLAFVSSFAGAAIDRARLSGAQISACEPMVLHGRATYTRLTLHFEDAKYTSSETLYSDPKCEISVLETASQGTWKILHGKVLGLRLSRMQMRPLDPRMADTLQESRTCGKSWEYGVPNEILGTDCGRGRLAEYFVSSSSTGRGIDLYECEGRRTVGPGCTHYSMTVASAVAAPKLLKTLHSSRVSRK
jgi:hypothetical protein